MSPFSVYELILLMGWWHGSNDEHRALRLWVQFQDSAKSKTMKLILLFLHKIPKFLCVCCFLFLMGSVNDLSFQALIVHLYFWQSLQNEHQLRSISSTHPKTRTSLFTVHDNLTNDSIYYPLDFHAELVRVSWRRRHCRVLFLRATICFFSFPNAAVLLPARGTSVLL